MGMSTYVYGIKPADEDFQRMLDAWKACNSAGMSIPKELIDYFGESAETIYGPDSSGVLIHLTYEADAVTEWCSEMQEGYEVDITKLPTDIKVIRFVNSY